MNFWYCIESVIYKVPVTCTVLYQLEVCADIVLYCIIISEIGLLLQVIEMETPWPIFY